MIDADSKTDKKGNPVRHPNRDNQNRSIDNWVEPGAKFATSIDVVISAEALS